MSIQLNLSRLSEVNETKGCHSMPCKIKYSGEANVNKYFKSTIIQNPNGSDDKELIASFRGRPLNGKIMEAPSGYQGLIIKEDKKPLTEDEDREFGVLAKVPNFTFWNLDKPVTEEDKLSKALIFTKIAQVLHQRDFEEPKKENGHSDAEEPES